MRAWRERGPPARGPARRAVARSSRVCVDGAEGHEGDGSLFLFAFAAVRRNGWRAHAVRALLSLSLTSRSSLPPLSPFTDDAHERTIASLSETLKSSARV